MCSSEQCSHIAIWSLVECGQHLKKTNVINSIHYRIYTKIEWNAKVNQSCWHFNKYFCYSKLIEIIYFFFFTFKYICLYYVHSEGKAPSFEKNKKTQNLPLRSNHCTRSIKRICIQKYFFLSFFWVVYSNFANERVECKNKYKQKHLENKSNFVARWWLRKRYKISYADSILYLAFNYLPNKAF